MGLRMTATAGNLILPAAQRTARLTASDALTDRCRLMCGAVIRVPRQTARLHVLWLHAEIPKDPVEKRGQPLNILIPHPLPC